MKRLQSSVADEEFIDEFDGEYLSWDDEDYGQKRRVRDYSGWKEEQFLAKLVPITMKRDRLYSFAMLRLPRLKSPARFIPQDVLRLIAAMVPAALVVLRDGHIAASRHRHRSVPFLVCDFGGAGLTKPWLQPTQLPLKQQDLAPRHQVPWPMDGKKTLFAESPTHLVAIVWALRPIPCASCKETADFLPHCCCCCPRVFISEKQRGGVASSVWSSAEHPHVSRDSFNFIFFQDRVFLVGGLDLDNHWLFDGCPTANTPTSSVLSWCPRDGGPWEGFTPMTRRRMNAAAVVVDGSLYVIGGEDGDMMQGFHPIRSVIRLPSSKQSTQWEDMSETMGLSVGVCSFSSAHVL